jgi:hypothetical protein
MKQPDLLLFAKAPVPGEVKTRLQPQFSPERAAEIATFMIRATIEQAVSFWPGDVYVHAWPDLSHPLFAELEQAYHVQLDTQQGVDLGSRMHNALAAAIDRRGAAAVLGCDVPHCPWDVLELAHDMLARGKSVLGPTKDGGYYLLGLQQAAAGLFMNIDWGTNRVALQTLAQAEQLQIEFEFLPRLRDVDTWGDLSEVAEGYAPLRRFL